MSFSFKSNETVGESVRRVACEQVEKSIAEINDSGLDRHEAVHQVRKRCKKIRGLIRIVRPAFEETYQAENAWYRDSARMLSYVRDVQSIIETFDKLTVQFRDQIDPDALNPVRKQLEERRDAVAADHGAVEEKLQEFLERMRKGRERIEDWKLENDEFSTVEGGMHKTYRRARKAMKTAYSNPQTETFHEWRKRAKYHWYHMRLLRPLWEKPVKARRDEAHLLSDYLGDNHDLSILRTTLLQNADAFGGDSVVQVLTGLIDRRQVVLRLSSETLGSRLFAEKPKHFTARMAQYRDAWHRELIH